MSLNLFEITNIQPFLPSKQWFSIGRPNIISFEPVLQKTGKLKQRRLSKEPESLGRQIQAACAQLMLPTDCFWVASFQPLLQARSLGLAVRSESQEWCAGLLSLPNNSALPLSILSHICIFCSSHTHSGRWVDSLGLLLRCGCHGGGWAIRVYFAGSTVSCIVWSSQW